VIAGDQLGIRNNTSHCNLSSTTEGAAAVGLSPALDLTTTFMPDGWGNVTATTDPLKQGRNKGHSLHFCSCAGVVPARAIGRRPELNHEPHEPHERAGGGVWNCEQKGRVCEVRG
jgi:serine/threonine protein kinase HipA of HipAB toxin-antitoxin module